MDQEIVEYLRAHPSAPVSEAGGGQHVHIHHHYPPAPAPPPPPGPMMAQKVVPWVVLGCFVAIIGTLCAIILAAVIVALVLGLVGVSIAAAVVAYLIKTTRESQINAALVDRLRDQEDEEEWK